ncbi:hypothetical protein DDE05_58100 [Streptomyces cavourensis]|nr:hypothetical protein DDE05_58100 [Streptomyces cavourensis]
MARMYDWLIGGRDNYPVDREACKELLRIAPSTRELALVNRAFLVRAVRYLAEQCGITQYIDHAPVCPHRPMCTRSSSNSIPMRASSMSTTTRSSSGTGK